MSFRVQVTRAAFEDLVAIGRWIASRGETSAAERWVASVLRALASLEAMPERCPLALEHGELEVEIRHMLIGEHRALFTVKDDEVLVLHVRDGRRRRATVAELGPALEELGRADGSGGA